MLRDVLLLQKREMEKRLKEEYVERDARIKEIKSDIIKVISCGYPAACSGEEPA